MPTLSGSRRMVVVGRVSARRQATSFTVARSTPASAGPAVDPAASLRIVQAFVERWLRPRRVYLNGKRASRYVDAVRRDEACGKTKHWQAIILASLEDAQDPDMPVGVVADVFEGFAKLLRAVAKGAQHDRELGITVPARLDLLLPSKKYEDAENDAELGLDLNSVDSIDKLLAASALERQAEDERNDALRSRRAKLVAAQAGAR